jgi:hypothetical protein
VLNGRVRVVASGSLKDGIVVGAGVKVPPLTVPTTPLLFELQALLGPATTLPLTAMEPPLTEKSPLPAFTSPRKHRLHLTAVPSCAWAELPTAIVDRPAAQPKKVATERVGMYTRTKVGDVELSSEMQEVPPLGTYPSAWPAGAEHVLQSLALTWKFVNA